MLYTIEQREALTAAYDHPARTATDVARMAAAGELEFKGERVPRFEISARTVRDVAGRVRRHRAAPALADAERLLGDELIKIALEEVRALRRQKKGERDLRRLKEATMVYGRIAEIARGATAARGFTSPPREDRGDDSPTATGGSLMQAMRATTTERPILPARRAPLIPVASDGDMTSGRAA